MSDFKDKHTAFTPLSALMQNFIILSFPLLMTLTDPGRPWQTSLEKQLPVNMVRLEKAAVFYS